MSETHVDFRHAFTDGARFAVVPGGDAASERTVRTVHVGELEVSSGRIAVSDSAWLHEPDALRLLAGEMLLGTYSVDLCFVPVPTSGDHVALARLRKTDARDPVRWTPVRDPALSVEGYFTLFDILSVPEHTLRPALPSFVADSMLDHSSRLLDIPSAGKILAVHGLGSLQFWWGLDEEQAIIELVVDFGPLWTAVWSKEVLVPIEALRDQGEVDAAGATLRIASPGEVPGPWTNPLWNEFAERMPPELRKNFPALSQKPDIDLALCITTDEPEAQYAVDLLDDAGRAIVEGRRNQHESELGSFEYWADCPAARTAKTVRLQRFDGARVPFTPL